MKSWGNHSPSIIMSRMLCKVTSFQSNVYMSVDNNNKKLQVLHASKNEKEKVIKLAVKQA